MRSSVRVIRAGVALALVVGLGVVISCTEGLPGAGGDGTFPTASGCATPQEGCPCTPGTVVACGHKVTGDNNFLYCYQGHRQCDATGRFGGCAEGHIVPLALGGIRPAAFGAPGPCTGGDNTPTINVCTSGKKQGEYCSSALDCTGGVKKCLGGANDGSNCKKEKDCADPGECISFNGTCSGGARNGFGCDSLADCPGGVACNPAGGGGFCGTFTGVCDNGTEDGEACNADADCGGGQCKGKKGKCQGGKENGKKCAKNKHCKGSNTICNAEDDPTADGGILDPCDPYCQVVTDTAVGIDAGPGFTISGGGLKSTGGAAVCGDSLIGATEDCDDGNTTSGDGCSSICKLEPNFQCPTPGSPCIASTCGNGVREGLEQCDDGNTRPYDGCSPLCTSDFNCPSPVGPNAQPCVAVCGDGIKFPSEACDDGNLRDGDGCSATCTVESGATCVTITAPNPPTIDVPVIYRDFTPTHPDFQAPAPHAPYVSGPCVGGACPARVGIPNVTLAADKAPVFASTQGNVGDATTFYQWYHDTPGVNQVILGKYIRLRTVAGAYVFDSNADTVYNLPYINCGNVTPTTTCTTLTGFYPINGLGYGNYAATGRNYHFTSEVRYPFTYAGGETLSFTGDDDVFVYIGGKKVVDLGGIHVAVSGSVTLGPATNTLPVSTPLNLVVGETYEIAVFQAERNTTGSNYRLTLQGFNRRISSCTPPPSSTTFYRDFEAVCGVGEAPVWQLFRWKAAVPVGSTIDFRAATAATSAALPASPPAAAPATVPIGSATALNSPVAAPLTWVTDVLPGPVPVPVSQHLQVEGLGTKSQRWLRVYMTFSSNAPTLFEWQQLYDCVPAE